MDLGKDKLEASKEYFLALFSMETSTVFTNAEHGNVEIWSCFRIPLISELTELQPLNDLFFK